MAEKILYSGGYIPKDFQGYYEEMDFDFGEKLTLRLPRLNKESSRELMTFLKARHEQIQNLSVARIIEAVDKTIKQLLDKEHPLRRLAQQWLPVITGYDEEVIRLGLTRYLKRFEAHQLHRFLSADFADPAVLEGFRPGVSGGYVKAQAMPVSCHIWAGNVPALGLWSFISACLVKSSSIGKVSAAEPLMTGLFARLLAENEPALANAFAVVYWQGGEEETEKTIFGMADVVAAYGNNETVEKIRQKVPITTRFLPYGHKLSLSVIAGEALDHVKIGDTLRRAVKDIVFYNQQGCYSPQVIFMEENDAISLREVGSMLAQQLARDEKRYGRRQLSFGEESSQRQWIGQCEIEMMERDESELFVSREGAWAVFCQKDIGRLGVPSTLNRTISVVSFKNIEELSDFLQKMRRILQTAGLAVPTEKLFAWSEFLANKGISRICGLGEMTLPQAGWHHDGRHSLMDFVQMVDLEYSAEQQGVLYSTTTD